MRKDHDFKRECTAMVCKCSRYGICSKEFQIAGQNSEAAKITNYGYSSCSAQQWSWEVVGRRQCAQGDAGSSWGSSASLIVDLIFLGQWNDSEVRCQPPCASPFACLGKHTSLAVRTNATFQVAKVRSKIIPANSVIWPILHQTSTPMSAAQDLETCV